MKVSWEKESKKKMVGDAGQLATASAIRSFKARMDLLRRSPRDNECFDAVETWLTKWLYTCNMNNYMKTKSVLLLACLTLIGTAHAQVITNPPAPPNPVTLPTQLLNYFTAFNTNLDTTFKDNRFDLWIGAASVQNVEHPLLNTIGGSYDVWRSNPGTNGGTLVAISPEADFRNEGVAGNLISVQGGVGLSAIIHDVKATVYLNGGKYIPADFDPWYGEIGLRVKKAFGQHFYGGVGLATQYRDIAPEQLAGKSKWGQVFTAYMGVTF